MTVDKNMCIITPTHPVKSSNSVLNVHSSSISSNPAVSKTTSDASLGSITKFESSYPSLTTQSLDTITFKTEKACANHQANRRSAYALKRTSEKLLPDFRVTNCLNKRVTAERGVDIRLNKENGRATFGNLMRCDSVWVCPCCSGRILSHRGKEVEKGVNTWQEVGGSTWMITLTHSHKKGENLAQKMVLLRKAVKRFFSDRAMKSVFEQMGKVGQIKALEFTHGKNGWHPHHHIMMFSKVAQDKFKDITVSVIFDKDNDNEIQYISYKKERQLEKWGHWHVIDEIQQVDFETFIKHYWRKICKEVGLGAPSVSHGVTVSDASNVKTYLTKFKTAQELTNAQAKRAKNGNRNQWEILADAHKMSALNNAQMIDTEEYKRALESQKLWREYALASKGEQQLHWSRGLKDLLMIDDIDDDEILEDGDNKDDEVISIYELQVDLFNYIKRKGWKAQVLEIVEDDFANETYKLIEFIEKVKVLRQQEHEEYLRLEQKRIEEMLPPWWYEYGDACS